MKLSEHREMVIVGAVLALVLLLGSLTGYHVGANKASTLAQAQDARHQKMLEFIVKRNPQASIRDFATLPDVILQVSAQHGLDYRLVMAIIDKESQFRPDAVGASGEIGLMQITPQTGALIAKRTGLAFTPPKRGTARTYADLGSLGDPAVNVALGVQYLAWQVEEFGGVGPTALRAYNRAPQSARAHWPNDRYAEDVSMGYVVLAARLPQ